MQTGTRLIVEEAPAATHLLKVVLVMDCDSAAVVRI